MSTDAFNNISFYAFKMTVLNNKPYEILTIRTYNVPYVKIFLDLIFYFDNFCKLLEFHFSISSSCSINKFNSINHV